MAESEQALVTLRSGAGMCQLVAIVEDTQTEPDSEGDPSPFVVRIRVTNSTGKRATGRWMQSNGQLVTTEVLTGENSETNIAPPRRVPLYRMEYSLAMHATARQA